MPWLVASVRSAPEQNTRPDDRISTTFTVVVGLGRLESLEQLGHQLPRQRVAVVRRVEGDRRDRAGDLEVDELCCAVGGAVGHVRHHRRMAYDVELADRLRGHLARRAGDREADVRRPRLPRRRQHGGRRERPGRADGALRPGGHRAARLAEPGASRIEMRGKPDGRLAARHRPTRWPTTTTLARWVAVGVTYARGHCRPSSHPRRLRSEQGACSSRLLYALFGVLATLVGVAAGHLVASLLNPASSPVLAVGSQVIDLTPTPMKEWAIPQFGDQRQADPDRLGDGRRARARRGRRPAGAASGSRYGAGLLVVLVAVAGVHRAEPARPPSCVDVVPSIAAALAGVGALWCLDRTARPTPTRSGARPTTSRRRCRTRAAAALPPRRPGRRRRARAATAVVMGGAGRWIGKLPHPARRHRAARARRPGAGVPDRASRRHVRGITPFRIPNDDFYRVDTRLDVPIVDHRRAGR